MKPRTGKMRNGTEIRKNEKSEAEKWKKKHLLPFYLGATTQETKRPLSCTYTYTVQQSVSRLWRSGTPATDKAHYPSGDVSSGATPATDTRHGSRKGDMGYGV